MHTLDLNFDSIINPFIDGLNVVLPRIPTVFLTLLIGTLLIEAVAWAVRMFMALTGVQQSFRQVLGSVIKIVLWAFLVIQLLYMLELGAIITFFTGSIVAIGLLMAAGGSTVISDIVGGLFLARDPDFNVGDEVIAGETPTEGTVLSMDARRIRIRDKDGRVHVIPNSVVERKEWVTISRLGGSEGAAQIVARKFTKAALSKAGAVREKVKSVENKDGDK